MKKITLSNSLKASLLYGASIAIMKGISLLMLPLIANYIAPQEFGRLEVISILAVIGSILVGMGLEDTLFRFAGPESDRKKRRHISAEIFTLALFIALLTLLLAWYIAPIIAPNFPGQPSIYEIRLVLGVLALEGCIAIPLGWLRLNNKALSFFFASTGRAILQALLVVIFLWLDRGVTGILEAGFIATLLQTFWLATIQLRDTGLRINFVAYKKSFIYSLPIVASGLVAFSLNGIDRWILAEQASLTQVAEFSIAAKFALAMVLLMQPFGMWWSPKRFEVLAAKNGKTKVAEIIAIGCCIALMITVSVALLAPAMIHELLPPSYLTAAQYVVAITLIMLLKELVELFNIGCFHGKTTSSQFIINLFTGIIGITCMFYLTPLYQVWGVIFSLLLAQSLRLMLFYKVSQYFLPLHYPVRALLILAIASSTWLVLAAQINNINHSLLIAISTMLCAVTSLLFIAYYLKLINLPTHFSKKVTL